MQVGSPKKDDKAADPVDLLDLSEATLSEPTAPSNGNHGASSNGNPFDFMGSSDAPSQQQPAGSSLAPGGKFHSFRKLSCPSSERAAVDPQDSMLHCSAPGSADALYPLLVFAAMLPRLQYSTCSHCKGMVRCWPKAPSVPEPQPRQLMSTALITWATALEPA